MHFLVFQHLNVEHPGVFRNFFQEDGIKYTAVELDEADPIPELSNFDALWVMGGPMDVWQEEEFPWLIDEKQAIREAVLDLKMPYMGICLGHQLLAAALGGLVELGQQSEVGIMPVTKTAIGETSPFLTGLPKSLETLQWHSAEVKTIPEQVNVLAESEVCQYQSLSIDEHVFTTQFHVEITRQTVPEWNEIPAYREALQKTLGSNGASKLEQQVNNQIESFNQNARILYENWKSTVF